MSELVSKISAKSVVGKIEPPEKSVPIMRLMGIVTDSKITETQYGESVGFIGEFVAINVSTGEEFRAGKAFLPKVAEMLMASIVKPGVAIEFAFDVGVKPADNKLGYEYTVKPLIEPKDSDPLLKLKSSLPELPKMLSAPADNKTAPHKKGGKK